MKFTILKIDPTGDSYTHLYFFDRLIVEGDYYHDKIDDYIKGYIDGYTHAHNIAEAFEVNPIDVQIEEIGFMKDDWIYEDFKAEDSLEDTIKRLEKDGFIRVENE